MADTMQQIAFSQYGQPDVLQLVKAAMPRIGAGEILLRVTAIGVNYSDVLRRRNTYFMPTPLPFVLGTEAVGVVEAVGKGVPAPFEKGMRLLAILPFGGGYATQVVVTAPYCVPLPPEISDQTATALFVQGSTAQLMVSQLAGERTENVYWCMQRPVG